MSHESGLDGLFGLSGIIAGTNQRSLNTPWWGNGLPDVVSESQVKATPDLPMMHWQGANGVWYVHSIIRGFACDFECTANYAFVQRHSGGRLTPHYFGIASNLRCRLSGHEKLNLAVRAGANELHVHLLAKTEAERREIEKTLIHGHSPRLNEQHNHQIGLGIF